MKVSRFARALLVLGVACAVVSGGLAAQSLRLKSGKFLVGRIEEPNEEGLTFVRFDTDGRLDLRWEDLEPSDAKRLRAKYHLVDPEIAGDVMVTAWRVLKGTPGGAPREVLGVLVARDGTGITLKRYKVAYHVALSEMRSPPAKVEVPIHEVLTPDEIYESKLAELQPGEDPDKHAELGTWLLRVSDYERARQHLLEAQKLGGGKQPKEVENLLARLEGLLANEAEADLITRMNQLRNRRRFTQALELAKQYEETYPQGKGALWNEYQRRREQLARDREAFLVRGVAGDWYRALRDEAGKIARDRSLSFDAARKKAEEDLPKALRARVARVRSLELDEVEGLFSERIDRRVAKVQTATYGTGSWILGKKAILKDTAADKAQKAKSKPSKEAARRSELEKRLREFLRKARRGQGGPQRGQADQLETEQQWWKAAQTLERQLFIIAWYAEHAGDVTLKSAAVNTCPTCGSRGFLEEQGTSGGKVVRRTCPTCHGHQYLRSIRFW